MFTRQNGNIKLDQKKPATSGKELISSCWWDGIKSV